MLTLNRPNLDWVQMARGMGVDACRVSDARDLARAMETGLAVDGPYLIEIEM
jgi:acetolactate synthase-1/2/3 large subunit